MAVMGWFVRQLWDASKELREDLATLRQELPKEYVLREDYRRDIYEIKQLLRQVTPDEMSMAGEPRQSPTTTRNYVRRSAPGPTRSGNAMQAMQMMGSGNGQKT
jgi:hypothetical protein